MARRLLVNVLYNKVLAHTTVGWIGCSHTGWDFGKHMQALIQPFQPRVETTSFFKTYPRWLKGSRLRQSTLNKVLAAVPALQSAVNDPLWEVLKLLGDDRCSIDPLALALGMGGIPGIAMNSRKAMHELCNCPDWRHLGYVLALLGSHDRSLQTYRTWLRKHFSRYLILLCLGEPLCFARSELFEVLSYLRDQKRLGPIDDWPGDLGGFEQACEAVMKQARLLQARGWISGGDQRSWTFVGYYLDSSTEQCQDPEGLARRVAVALQQHERNHFGFCQPRTAA